MLLCLDVGNSHIFGGVFEDNDIRLRFRYSTKLGSTSDELGLFLKSVIRENGIDAKKINQISYCSVVPHLDYSLRSACIKYFNVEPFALQAGVKTGLKIKVSSPAEVGADRIANAIAATHQFINRNIIVIDFGTATTFCAITSEKEYLGGAIAAGIKISMEGLQSHTAKLSAAEIVRPETALGRTTKHSIQSGIYYGHLGLVREMTQRITQEAFDRSPIVIGTGGFANLFNDDHLFTIIVPDLVLHGLRLAHSLNPRYQVSRPSIAAAHE